MSDQRTKLERRLDEIIGVEDIVREELDNLDDVEDVRSLPVPVYEEKESKQVVAVSEDALDDYKFVRTTIYGLLARGTAALEGALVLAKESEQPRAYEVVSTLMRNISDISNDLVTLHDKVNKKSNTASGGTTTIQNQTNVQNNITVKKEEDVKEVQDILGQLDDG